MTTMNRPLHPALRRRLVTLNRALGRVIGFESIVASRDPTTGVFKSGGAISGKSLRAAWSIPPRRTGARNKNEVFKQSLLAALRSKQ